MKNTVIGAIVLIVIAGIGIWAYLSMNKSSVPYSAPTTVVTSAPVVTASTENTIYKMASDPKLGEFLTDPKGMTLYTFVKDTTGKSNCTETCLTIWPIYTAPSESGTFPTDIAVIKRADGTLQYTWKGKPLYYFNKDVKPGDVNGQGVGGVWFVAK